MISLDLIEFADLVRPVDIINQILKQNNWIDGAVPLEEIAKAAGIRDIQYVALNSFEGSLLANAAKTDGIIVINSGTRHQRQRFTLGHELGHFMIPRHGHRMECSKFDLAAKPSGGMSASVAIEAEANLFSAELLMPERLLSKLSSFNKEPSIEGIKLTAEKFDVSFQAMAVRFADIHDSPIAFVMSRNGKVEYGYKRDNFPFWLRVGKKGDSVPPKSITGMADVTKEETVGSDECLSSMWFDGNRYYDLPENLIEEVYVQKDGYVATILWFEDEVAEK